MTALLPVVPAELIEEAPDLADLFVFQRHPLATLPAWLHPHARQLLNEQGLPREAAPYLSFFDAERAAEVSAALPAPGWAIGHDGGGNVLAIDAASGEVVMWDHDNGDARVFANRDLLCFAECLCGYYRCMETRQAFPQVVAKIDPRAMAEGGFWLSRY
ncbi:SUKH-4 family immunity protein [Stenotrophomonas sp. ESTM1D_MKCIP4_1]|uniref:SUKH-4 family immunity protein n=1 Tax=Stenotrophomonas sp. ESTM1D_MKCIP4_1 TaxID=2072414 RepID=UPI00131F199E|nr:SUKH-4 family immunity protein [Stenotrophomonas sp. ESTM1D_MKCIP4_1]